MLTSGDDTHGLTYAVVECTRSSQPKLQYKLGGGCAGEFFPGPLLRSYQQLVITEEGFYGYYCCFDGATSNQVFFMIHQMEPHPNVHRQH